MTTDPAPGPSPGATPTPRRTVDVLVLLGFFVLWVVLQAWVLPKAGVRT
ncbi:MAG TPA: hypothetical protein VGE74_17080 [Gemmata sp.]